MAKCETFVNHENEFIALKKLCKTFYTLPGCGAGGPLHILLDDDNYRDGDIEFCIQQCLFHPEPTIMALGLMICHEYLKMPMKTRAIFDAYWSDRDMECCEACEECDYITDDDWHWIEKENENG